MDDIDRMLKEIMHEFEADPNKVWEYLEEDDLLVTHNDGQRFIIGVDYYDPQRRMIKVKWIYSLGSDKFYIESGWETPALVERYPFTREVEQLRNNLDYLTYAGSK